MKKPSRHGKNKININQLKEAIWDNIVTYKIENLYIEAETGIEIPDLENMYVAYFLGY